MGLMTQTTQVSLLLLGPTGALYFKITNQQTTKQPATKKQKHINNQPNKQKHRNKQTNFFIKKQ